MLDAILRLFADYLDVRLEKGVFTTEDSVRYTFFAALLASTDLRPEDVIQEYPYPTIARARLDTHIPAFAGRGLALEFKYDRKIPSGRNAPRPQKAGKLFHDIHRLKEFTTDERCIRVFVYLADDEMAGYLSNRRNNLAPFFNLPQGQSMTIAPAFFEDKSTTFQGAAGAAFSATLCCLLSVALPQEHHLRVYAVENDTPASESIVIID